MREPGELRTGLPPALCPRPPAPYPLTRGGSDQLGRHLTQRPWAVDSVLLPADTFSLVIVQHKPSLNKNKRNHPDLSPKEPFASGVLP